MVAYSLTPIEHKRPYLRVSHLAANSLKNTELLANMTPYVKITDEKGRIYHTTTALGRTNLMWDIDLLLPHCDKIVFEVMDRDLMYDDDVGRTEVNVPDALRQRTNKFSLHTKKADQGTLEVEFSAASSAECKTQTLPVLQQGGFFGIKFVSIKLADKNYRA